MKSAFIQFLKNKKNNNMPIVSSIKIYISIKTISCLLLHNLPPTIKKIYKSAIFVGCGFHSRSGFVLTYHFFTVKHHSTSQDQSPNRSRRRLPLSPMSVTTKLYVCPLSDKPSATAVFLSPTNECCTLQLNA